LSRAGLATLLRRRQSFLTGQSIGIRPLASRIMCCDVDRRSRAEPVSNRRRLNSWIIASRISVIECAEGLPSIMKKFGLAHHRPPPKARKSDGHRRRRPWTPDRRGWVIQQTCARPPPTRLSRSAATDAPRIRGRKPAYGAGLPCGDRAQHSWNNERRVLIVGSRRSVHRPHPRRRAEVTGSRPNSRS